MRKVSLKFTSSRLNSDSTCKECSCYTVSDLFKICANNQQLPSLKHYSYPQTQCDLSVNQPNINHLGSLVKQSEQLQGVFENCNHFISDKKAQLQQRQIDEQVNKLVNQKVEEQLRVVNTNPNPSN